MPYPGSLASRSAMTDPIKNAPGCRYLVRPSDWSAHCVFYCCDPLEYVALFCLFSPSYMYMQQKKPQAVNGAPWHSWAACTVVALSLGFIQMPGNDKLNIIQ